MNNSNQDGAPGSSRTVNPGNDSACQTPIDAPVGSTSTAIDPRSAIGIGPMTTDPPASVVASRVRARSSESRYAVQTFVAAMSPMGPMAPATGTPSRVNMK